MTLNAGEGEAAERFQSLLEDIPGIVVYVDRVQPDDRDRCAAADAEARATLSELSMPSTG